MSPPAIRIKIGAALDSSVDRVFAQIEVRAGKASANTTRAAQKAARDRTRADEKAADDSGKAAERGAVKAAKEAEKAAAKAQAAAKKMSDAFAQSWTQIAQVAEREMAKAARATERAEQRAGRAFARRTSFGAARMLTPYAPLASIAKRTVSDLARGAGVDLSIGNSVARNVSLETEAIGLAQQERIATGGRTAGADHYAAVGRKTGTELGVAPTQSIELMRAFSGKTGEFSNLEEVVKRLGPLAIASGTGFKDMGDSAAYFYNQVKHLPNAMQLTEEGMRAIIGQTAVGSVEMPDFAKQMGRIAANAPKFAGPRDHVIAQSSALAQLAIESGGATSAADAARSVSAFGDTFGKKARIGAFQRHGVKVFSDPGQTQLRDQFDIIRDSIRATKGNIPALADMFASTIGQKPVKALVSKYTDAGGGEAGMKAVDEALAKYMGTMLTADAQQKNVADHLASTAAKTQKFQNQLDEIVERVQTKMLPTFDALAPKVLALSEALGGAALWISNNLGLTISGAIVASMGRAGLESTMRAGLERIMMGEGGGAAAGVGKAAGNIGAIATIATIGVGTFTVTAMTVEALYAKSQQEQKERVERDLAGFGDLQAAKRLADAGDTEGAAAKVKGVIGEKEKAIAEGEENKGSVLRSIADFLVEFATDKTGEGKEANRARDAAEARALEQQRTELAESKRLLAMLHEQLAGGLTIKSMPKGIATQ
jgi:hypothetical protein